MTYKKSTTKPKTFTDALSQEKIEAAKKNLGFYTFGKLTKKKLDIEEYVTKEEHVDFGKDNDAPDELLWLYENAHPLHTALIDKKAQMIAGSGLVKDLIAESISDKLFFENRFGEDDLDGVTEKLAFDLAIFNGGYLQVIFDETGETVVQIEHLPFQNVRAEKSLDLIGGWFVSRNWKEYKKEENRPIRYASFNPDLAKHEGTVFKSQILAIRVYTAGMKYYPKPTYMACINSLKSSYSLGNYNAKSIDSGFNAGTIIINKGIYTPEEQKQLHKDIKKNYTLGESDDANDFIMMFAPTPESVPEIKAIENNFTEGRFLELKDSIVEDIILGHKASSQVAGKETAGALLGKAESKEAHDIFNNTVIKPLQKKIEDALNWIAEVNGLTSEFKLNDYDFLEFTEEVDESQAVFNALNNLQPQIAVKVMESMTQDEIRALVGLGAIPTGEPTTEEPATEPEPPNTIDNGN